MTGSAADARVPLLTARQVKVHLKVNDRIIRAVDGVDLELYPGECVGILGESGSGKSTFGRAITRLLPNVALSLLSGEVLFGGSDIAHMPEPELRALRRHGGFSMVFQDPLGHLNPTRRIAAQIDEALRAIDQRQARARRATLLEQVGLSDVGRVLRAYPHELSGGMRQRVLLAMALAAEPKMLVADEPTTALDATVQMQVIETLRRVNREQNVAMLIITHNFGLVAELCDRVYVMNNGRFVESADVISLFESPRHPYTKSLIAAGRRLLQPQPRT